MMLVRLVYENYLRIIYLRRFPESVDNFIAMHGVYIGTHEYAASSSGKRDYRTIIDKKTGGKYHPISNIEMVRASDLGIDVELYEQLYPMLCNYSHISVDAALNYFSQEEGFLIHKEDNPFLGLQWASMVNAILLDELCNIEHINKTTKRDLAYMAARLQKHLLPLFKEDARVRKQPDLICVAVERLKLIGSRK